MKLDDLSLAIVGLGYVGLPLAVSFSKKRKVIAFDINSSRIKELISGHDATLEVNKKDLLVSENLYFTDDIQSLVSANCFIITVPTPILHDNSPDLGPLHEASKTIASILKPGDIVIYESTVYPGATEEECVPILESISKLTFNKDFFVGYSPERINPGDKSRTIDKIVKVTSGSTKESADLINKLYLSIIDAGTHLASSIKVAEAAKVIENTQRDINIGLINELAIIFNRLEINTTEVLEAAGTKWNFLPFQPGLVGGHCIGVDPYYLTYKAQAIGYEPKLILAARKLNDEMSRYISLELIKQMIKKNIEIVGSKILIMGVTFKENCPDVRNTKVINIVNELSSASLEVECYDPWVTNTSEIAKSVNLVTNLIPDSYNAIILAVPHKEFLSLDPKYIRSLCKINGLIYDLKNILPINETDIRL